ncbi:hypothetical protein [Abyssalbus ytuae]|uniref:Uncharacterized protein n=1 Tax=Abyssalbus ytuae TaxID=2926907 RepID=A0A9E6ZL89_9FLAO|nr:hypothetical protein [Abyssalbus ytuae]UOB16669.1 hypothetical protein MQE35_13095 [Abyssalbus ytuae]
MKTIKLTPVIVIGLFITSLQAQTWSINHVGAEVEKGIALGYMGTEIGLIADQIISLEALKALEKDYNDRRKLNSNFKSLPMMVATLGAIEFSEKQVNELEKKIKTMKGKRLYFKYGLKKLESNLSLEKKYLKEIRSEYAFLLTAIPLSGGPGYNYTAFLKVLIRTLQIRRNVLSIEYKVNNLITNNKIFKR